MTIRFPHGKVEITDITEGYEVEMSSLGDGFFIKFVQPAEEPVPELALNGYERFCLSDPRRAEFDPGPSRR